MPQKQTKICCPHCGRTLPLKDFFTARTEAHSDGFSTICKQCFYDSLSTTDPNTFMNMLHNLDMPWLPAVYRRVFTKNATATSYNSSSIFGKYISAIKLNPYISLHFSDSLDFQLSHWPQETPDDPTSYDYTRPLGAPVMPVSQAARLGLYVSVNGEFVLPSDISSTTAAGAPTTAAPTEFFTPEEKRYLINKWGQFYTIEQLISLERLYLEMMEDMDIRTATQKDHLKKMCVVSLRYDEALAASDFDGARKASGMYSAINKEAGFQPIQSQSQDAEYLDAVGVIVRMAEAPSPIPVWDLGVTEDEIDILLKDYKLFVKRLVDNDDTISTRINEAAQELAKQDSILSSGEMDDGAPVDTTTIDEMDFETTSEERPEVLGDTIDFGSVYDNVDNVTEKTEKEVMANLKYDKPMENAEQIKSDFMNMLEKYRAKHAAGSTDSAPKE